MALTVAPAANADSYVSIADADAYLAGRGAGAAWSTLATDDKEIALRLATEYIDGIFGSRFIGQRTASAQALAWPRKNVFMYESTVSLDDALIPKAIKNATAYLALESRSVSLASNAGAAVKREKIGPIETEYAVSSGSSSSQLVRFPFLSGLLADYLSGGFFGPLLTRRI